MVKLGNIEKVYCIGIGGIGMSALARYFQSKDIEVSGYDKTPTPLTKSLEESGILIHYEEDTRALPLDVQLVIYTPAIPADHQELQYYQKNGFNVLKRSEVLALISDGTFNICVAGTHGKTTISTMVAHILRHSGYGCNAFLGGIATNYNTNFWSNERNVCVIEADEYDRSFLRLHPNIAIISAMDADHLDIYGTEEAFQQAFIDFTQNLKPGGLLVCKYGLKRRRKLLAERIITYSLQNDFADVYAVNMQMKDGSYIFDVMMKDNRVGNVVLNMGGLHNVENAVAAIAVAHELGIDSDLIKDAVEAFSGVKRRFEYIIKSERIIFVDDYAHHPEELKALLGGAKTLFNGRKLTIIFQPHLFSRTKDMAHEFAESLDLADEVILLPIYPAREQPIEGVSSRMILAEMQNNHKKVLNRDECLKYIEERFIPGMSGEFGEVLITAGAGDIDSLVPVIKKMFE
ncbi:MAG: UDP-N-acetylmuramate--L-alanine ligase [Chitinophagaceae bacterium]